MLLSHPSPAAAGARGQARRRSSRSARPAVRATAHANHSAVSSTTDRRSLLIGAPAAATAALLWPGASPPPAAAGQAAEVSTYLPPADQDGLYLFVPDRKKTPVRSWRAGCWP